MATETTNERRFECFLKEMKECHGDPEDSHIAADDILCRLVLEMSWDFDDDSVADVVEEILEAWRKVPKWYA